MIDRKSVHSMPIFRLPEAMTVDAGEFPDLYLIRQDFERPQERDVAEAVTRELTPILPRTLDDESVAITVGSRKISCLDEIVRVAATLIRARGGEPFIAPAMGSHGGATPDGQAAVLRDLNGITEQTVGCEIRSSLEVAEVGRTASGYAVYTDTVAAAADWVLIVNRVKPHTRFAGRVESGLCKMLVVGLGNQVGASAIHHHAVRNDLGDTIIEATRILVDSERPRLLAGIGIVENAYEEIAQIRGVPMDRADELIRREAELLQEAYRLMPSLPADEIDILVVDEVGKDISGLGMDTTIIGRKQGRESGPQIGTIYARSLTEATKGNAMGIGNADVVHHDIANAIEPQSTYINAMTARRLPEVRLPLIALNDRQALEILATYRSGMNVSDLQLVWIRSTSHLGKAWITAPLIDHIRPGCQIVAGPQRLEFSPDGRAIIPKYEW